MPKPVEKSFIATEIKKEYLKEHLNSTKSLIESWVHQLTAPSLFAPWEQKWDWQSVYQPPLEQDLDSIHILRRHLRSRTLWHHHANWEIKLSSIWHLANQVVKQTNDKHLEQSGKKARQYSEYYIWTALWKGFELACGSKIYKLYKATDDKIGVAFGAYKIEMSAASAKKRSAIEKEHWDFIHTIAEIKAASELAGLWFEASGIKEQMTAIAGKALKSNDILYPCKFCRHLWK